MSRLCFVIGEFLSGRMSILYRQFFSFKDCLMNQFKTKSIQLSMSLAQKRELYRIIWTIALSTKTSLCYLHVGSRISIKRLCALWKHCSNALFFFNRLSLLFAFSLSWLEQVARYMTQFHFGTKRKDKTSFDSWNRLWRRRVDDARHGGFNDYLFPYNRFKDKKKRIFSIKTHMKMLYYNGIQGKVQFFCLIHENKFSAICNINCTVWF